MHISVLELREQTNDKTKFLVAFTIHESSRWKIFSSVLKVYPNDLIKSWINFYLGSFTAYYWSTPTYDELQNAAACIEAIIKGILFNSNSFRAVWFYE